MSDESILPWQRAEKPAPVTDLQEKLERQQIAMLRYLHEIGPTGSEMIVLELTTGERLVIMAGRANQGRFSARLYFRWLPRPQIVLPRIAAIWSGGRSRDPEAEPPDDLQKAVEGCVIHGVLHSSLPMKNGGEQLAIEMVGGGRFAIGAIPAMKWVGNEIMTADLDLQWSKRERTYIHGV